MVQSQATLKLLDADYLKCHLRIFLDQKEQHCVTFGQLLPQGWLALGLRPLHQIQSSHPSRHWLLAVRVQRLTSNDPDRELIVRFAVSQVRDAVRVQSTFSLCMRALHLSFRDLAV